MTVCGYHFYFLNIEGNISLTSYISLIASIPVFQVGAIAIFGIGIWTHEVEYGSKQLAGLIGAPLYQVDSVMLIIAGSAIFCFTAVGLAGILLPQKCLLGLVSIWG